MGSIQELFERFGVVIVFINALLHELAVPIPLTPTVLVAALGMHCPKSRALTALGAALWPFVVILIGVALQQAVLAFLKALAAVPAGIWLAAGIVVLGSVTWRLIVRRRAMKALDVPRLA